MNRAWTGKTGGTKWMQQSLIFMFSKIDSMWVYPIMSLWVLGYVAFVPATRRGIWFYWRKARRQSLFKAIYNFYCSYFEFGKVILDRFGMFAGRKMNVTIVNNELLDEVNKSSEGCVIIGSHVGNMEAAGYSFQMKKSLYALIYMGDTETVNSNRTKIMTERGISIIPTKGDGSHVFDVHNVLSDGKLLLVHGDRLFFGDRTIVAPFIGIDAEFPEGPYHIAVAERVPVLSMFMMRDGHNRYTLYVNRLSDGSDLDGKRHSDKAKMLLQRQIGIMEQMLDKYPKQWFNFYEFWKISNGKTAL